MTTKLNEVSPEIRATTRQIISFGDESLLMNISLIADITRAGIFQITFTVPQVYEINSLSGPSLHHWSDEVVDESREITLHLNGKTLGKQEFIASLTSSPPTREDSWPVPSINVNEANRQNGDLIIQPATGIRLSIADRKNISELDPRELGAKQKGALAFRLLQKDWSATLDIETLAPRITGDILHDVTIREAQVRTSVTANLKVENAAIRSLQVHLPVTVEEASKTVRASGKAINSIKKVVGGDDPNLWEIELKRWITGNLAVQIEWEERATVDAGAFTQSPVSFPGVRQPKYHFAVRPTGRLEASLPAATQPWRKVDWKTVPKNLREANNRITPVLSLRSRSAPDNLTIDLKRHSLADALKLRVKRGAFRTVLSPHGTRLTSANLQVEVIQRSHLTMTLPPSCELFCLFVNGETVQPVKLDTNSWKFPVLPDTNGRQAAVFAVYLEPGETISPTELIAPLLSVPMENISWEVLSPRKLELSKHSGNLNLDQIDLVQTQDRSHYLIEATKRRKQQEQQAIVLLEKANQLLQSGQQALARQALSSVANRTGLDAASNEDARVQLETLQTQQALVGLNTRRQRMYLDRSAEDAANDGSEQLRESASRNPVIQMGDLNFRPGDLSQLLQGNSSDELFALRKIASRIVQQQQSEEIASRGLDISPPYEGNRYRFTRGIQVSEDVPLSLKLSFSNASNGAAWRWLAALGLLMIVCVLVNVKTN